MDKTSSDPDFDCNFAIIVQGVSYNINVFSLQVVYAYKPAIEGNCV